MSVPRYSHTIRGFDRAARRFDCTVGWSLRFPNRDFQRAGIRNHILQEQYDP